MAFIPFCKKIETFFECSISVCCAHEVWISGGSISLLQKLAPVMASTCTLTRMVLLTGWQTASPQECRLLPRRWWKRRWKWRRNTETPPPKGGTSDVMNKFWCGDFTRDILNTSRSFHSYGCFKPDLILFKVFDIWHHFHAIVKFRLN